MPEDHLALLVVEVEQLELAAGFEGAVEVPQLLRVAVEARDDGALVQAVRDALGNVAGGGLPRDAPVEACVSRRSRYGFWGAGWACGAAYSLMLPSGIVIEMGSRGFFAMSSSYFFLSRSKLRHANS